MPPNDLKTALHGLTVFERGWLSSNNVLLHGNDNTAVLVDSGHVVHSAQTLALLHAALGSSQLVHIVNTHLHSDHCGGNARVQAQWGCTVAVPPGHFAAARDWDEEALSYRASGQVCERFVPDRMIRPGDTLAVGQRQWQALAAPGHDPHSIMLFDAQHGVLMSADALWENGFGVVFPELEGEHAFEAVGETLDLIEALGARWVIPGHGAPFDDLAGALQRARRRLAGFVADPPRHRKHGIRVLVKYHLMEVQRQRQTEFVDWFAAVPLCMAIWQGLGRPEASLPAFAQRVLEELVGSGALALQDGVVLNV